MPQARFMVFEKKGAFTNLKKGDVSCFKKNIRVFQ